MLGRHALLGLALVIAGCTSIGPPTLRRDRLDYADALADASKRETLLNIVKLRYADSPSLVTVNQLVAGYTLEGRVDLRSDFFTENFNISDDVNFGVGGTFSDRPTVTYTPIKGDNFARVMLTPIPPSELFAMLTTGAPGRAHPRPCRAIDQRAAQLDGGCPGRAARQSGIRRGARRFWARCGVMASWASASIPRPVRAPPICSWRTRRAMHSRRARGACSVS